MLTNLVGQCLQEELTFRALFDKFMRGDGLICSVQGDRMHDWVLYELNLLGTALLLVAVEWAGFV